MSSQDNLIDAGLSFFDGFYKADLNAKQDIFFDNKYVEKRVNDIKNIINLSSDDCKILQQKIIAQYQITQDNGIAILGDYNHNDNWYQNREVRDSFFWDRYKRHLVDNGFSPIIVDKLGDQTLPALLSYIGNPHAPTSFAMKGLVIGDVQAGKTSNYIGLICKAVDAGYRVVFLLTGVIESLRQQTQIRVEEGFVGWDIVNEADVGVGTGEIVPFSFTTRENDFVKGVENNTALLIEKQSQRPYIFVIKKNVSILKKIYQAIKRNLKHGDKTIKFPMIMIDDEADNASINTNKTETDPTQTNRHIRNLLALFDKSNYVGFTATPFANVFIDPYTDDEMLKEDLFPKDFIYALYPPSNYHGAKKMFVDNQHSDRHMIQFLDSDAQSVQELTDILPLDHKSNYSPSTLPSSLYQAVDRFFLVNAIMDLQGVGTRHRSMLVNSSRFVSVQFAICELVQQYLDCTKNDIRQAFRLSANLALQNDTIKRLHDLFVSQYSQLGFEWGDILQKLFDATKRIVAVAINSKNDKKLDYKSHKDGFRVVAIGGLTLSRGLTLEGLVISYFYRNSTTFDVLMQMGRWFGYRQGYANLCKVYMTQSSANYYREIVRSTEQLKLDMHRMCDAKQKPTQFGIRVRNEFYSNLRITDRNKMRSVRQVTVSNAYWGEVFSTSWLSCGQQNQQNIKKATSLVFALMQFVDKTVTRHTYFRDIDKSYLVDFLQELDIDVTKNNSFDNRQLAFFVKTQQQKSKFDLLLMGGACEPVQFCDGVYIRPVNRHYKLHAQSNFVQINHNKLSGLKDMQYGLCQDDLQEIERNAIAENQKNYLIAKRNPLLILYMVNPSNFERHDELDQVDWLQDNIALKDKIQVQQQKLFENDLKTQEDKYLLGIQLGFPTLIEQNAGEQTYFTNVNADYYQLQAEFDSQELLEE